MSISSAARGLLVVDAIEARGLRYITNQDGANGVYLLFQIATNVQRTRAGTTTSGSLPLKWTEESQCRFDIKPEAPPVLEVYAMQGRSQGLPMCLAKGEINLIDAFYQKESDRWIKLSPLGQVNVELTFYELQPLLPAKKRVQRKQTSHTVPPQSPATAAVQKKETNTDKLISSVDRVFEDDAKEARGRLRDLARRVQRRYKESVASHYDSIHKRRTSRDMLINEMNESPKEKTLPNLPSSATVFDEPHVRIEDRGLQSPLKPAEQSPTRAQAQRYPLPPPPPPPLKSHTHNSRENSATSESSANTTFSRSGVDLSSLTLDEPLKADDLDLSNVPFSASSIGTSKLSSEQQLQLMRKEHARKKEEDFKTNYVPVSPEMYALVDRLEKGLVTRRDFEVDEGVSMYNGDGTWKRGCLRDSVPTNAPPVLPPKIPVGMRPEEFFVLNKRDYIEYFRTVKLVGGL